MNKFFTIACLIFCVNSIAQKIELIEINPLSLRYDKNLPFGRIEVIDSRYDTTKIGYSPKSFSFKKLNVAPSFSTGLQNCLDASLKSNFDQSKSETLLIVIKNFWIKDALTKDQSELGSQCTAKLELYLRNDSSYFPIVRIDTVFTFGEPLRNGLSDLILLPFQQSLMQLERIDFGKVYGIKKLKWKDIEDFNERRFQKPIYSANIQRGIYLTFKDFLENNLDNRDFEIQFGKLTDQLYLVDKDSKKIFTDFWAVCDGNKLYINSNLNFYELVRIDKGFEFWANAELIGHTYPSQFRTQDASAQSIAQGLGNYGMQKLLTPKSNYLRPFQVNMENGSVY